MSAPRLVPLPGGESGETFLASAPDGETVVRVYGAASAWRGPAAPLVDAAVLRLVRGVVPVPEPLEVRAARDGAPGLLVCTLLPGVRGDLVLADLHRGAGERLVEVGRALGAAAARVAGVPVAREGAFADERLAVADFPPATAPGEVVAAVEAAYEAGTLSSYDPGTVSGLRDVAARAEATLAEADPGTVHLAHGDLGPRNLLLEEGSGALLGVVDWEYAHATTVPWADLGTLVRHHRGPTHAGLVAGALDGWRETTSLPDPPGAPALLDLARAADLLALAHLAGRPGRPGERAHALLVATGRTRDLHAVAPSGPGADRTA